jgi:hypothetical protein
MSVSVNGTNGITFNDGTTQATVGYVPWRNRIINGDMRIDQRNAGASFTPTTPLSYGCDRWRFDLSQASKFTAQRSTVAPTGYTNAHLVTSSSAYSVLAGDYFTIGQIVEGLNAADLGWGTASAQSITLSFWVRSSLTGTFGGAVSNSAQNRSYAFTYTISAANSYEYKTVTIPGDTAGTWLTDNGIGIRVFFGLGVGSTYLGAAGSWAGAAYLSATGAISVVGTNGATFYITGVQLEAGSTATPFERVEYGEMLRRCQRYYQQVKTGGYGVAGSATSINIGVPLLVTMRSAPTVAQTGVIVLDNFYSVTSTQSSPSITTINADTNNFMARFANVSTFTAGQPCQIAPGNTNFVTASAEL